MLLYNFSLQRVLFIKEFTFFKIKIYIFWFIDSIFLFINKEFKFKKFILKKLKILNLYNDDVAKLYILNFLNARWLFKDDFFVNGTPQDKFLDLYYIYYNRYFKSYVPLLDLLKFSFFKEWILLWSTEEDVLNKNKKAEDKINNKQKIKFSFLAYLNNLKKNDLLWLFFFPIFNFFQLILLYSWVIYRFTANCFKILNIFLFKGYSAYRTLENNNKYKGKKNLPSIYYFMSNYFSMYFFKKIQFAYMFNQYNNGVKKDYKLPLFFFYIFKFFKNFLVAFIIIIIFINYSFFVFKLPFLKTLSLWFLLGFFGLYFFSTFNFFIKRYKYGKYTSAVQRFWKRAFMCFWLIEGFFFIILIYYLFNASGEPLFGYDTFGLYTWQLLSVKNFIFNSFFIVFIIHLFIFLIINIKFISLRKNIYLFLALTVGYLYLLFSESYQCYYILNFYIEYTWSYSEDDSTWELTYDIPRTRNKNHYLTFIIIAKFWHYVFIFISWIFFLMKTLELNRIRYSFLSMNFQNIIFFYIMSWIYLYSWLKWVLRRFFDQSYYWFFNSFRPITLNCLINDFFLYLFNSINFYKKINKYTYNFSFFYLNFKYNQFFSITTIFTQNIAYSLF